MVLAGIYAGSPPRFFPEPSPGMVTGYFYKDPFRNFPMISLGIPAETPVGIPLNIFDDIPEMLFQ